MLLNGKKAGAKIVKVVMNGLMWQSGVFVSVALFVCHREIG